MKEKVFYQVSGNSCGIAALKSMLYYYSNCQTLIEKEDLLHQEYSFQELKEIAQAHNMSINGYQIENIDFTQLKPSILLVNNNNVSHYVFFIKAKKNNALIIDPSIGKIKMDLKYLKTIFLNKVLLFEAIEVKKTKRKINKTIFLDLCLEIILSLPFFLFITFFILNKEISLYLIIMMLFSFFLRKIILLLRMKLFDYRLTKYELKNIDENLIKKIYAYKSAKYSFFPTLYNFILYNFAFFLFTLLLKNGYILTLSYLIYLLYKVITFKFDLAKLNSSFNYLNNLSLKEKYQNMNTLTNNYILKNEVIKIVSSILLIALTLILNFYFYHSNELMFSLSIFIFFLVNKDDLYTLNKLNKDLQIGETIISNMK